MAESHEKFGAIGVGVRVAMGQVDLIVIMQELKLEGESVVEATTLFLQRVLEITYVLTVTIPANTLTVI